MACGGPNQSLRVARHSSRHKAFITRRAESKTKKKNHLPNVVALAPPTAAQRDAAAAHVSHAHLNRKQVRSANKIFISHD
jgi:hypothetical protein